MYDLTDRIAVVSGAASGIGEAIAHLFARQGAHVYIADCDAENGPRVATRIVASGARAMFAETDVGDDASCRALSESVLRAHGRCDILVNNAGVGHVGTILSTSDEDLDRLYRVNVKGVHHLSRSFLPAMVERRRGSVVNMASVGGVIAVRDRYAYCVSKFAVVGLTKSMALDLARYGVRVNCICPGRVETPFVQARLLEYPDPAKAYQEMVSTQLLNRMARPEEIAAAALYLASDEAGFVTGSCLMIDGGWSAGK